MKPPENCAVIPHNSRPTTRKQEPLLAKKRDPGRNRKQRDTATRILAVGLKLLDEVDPGQEDTPRPQRRRVHRGQMQGGEGRRVDKDGLFKRYQEWAVASGYKPLSKQNLVKRLKPHVPGFREKKIRIEGQRRRRILTGIQLG